MSAESGRVASVSQGGSCAATVTEQILVLARSLPGSHDAGFEQSRQLARTFCDEVSEASRTAALDSRYLADLCRRVLSAESWGGWHLSFCVVEQRGGDIKAFNCGITGMLWVSDAGTCRPLLAPQTVARKLSRERMITVPPHLANIGATMAGPKLSPADIELASLEPFEGGLIIAVADPRILEALQWEDRARSLSSNALIERITGVADSLSNPERTFVLWRPARS